MEKWQTWAPSPLSPPVQVARESDVVLACLTDVAASEQVFLGGDGVIANSRPGQILVDHSTVGINTSRACAEAAQARGSVFLDAPISGGTERAADGTLTIMAGGTKRRIRPGPWRFRRHGRDGPLHGADR